MLDENMAEQLAQSVAADKRRLIEIANSTPRDTQLAWEYEAVYDRIVENERQINAARGLPRAYPVDIAKVRWDQRTDDVLVLSSQRYPFITVLFFVHSASAMDRMNLATICTFCGSATARTTRIEIDDPLEYPLGIVGLDRLGAFLIEDSSLVRDLTSEDSGSLQHYCFVFESIVFECVATSMSRQSSDQTSMRGELERAWSELRGLPQ